jgi:hypothetical protein
MAGKDVEAFVEEREEIKRGRLRLVALAVGRTQWAIGVPLASLSLVYPLAVKRGSSEHRGAVRGQ